MSSTRMGNPSAWDAASTKPQRASSSQLPTGRGSDHWGPNFGRTFFIVFANQRERHAITLTRARKTMNRKAFRQSTIVILGLLSGLSPGLVQAQTPGYIPRWLDDLSQGDSAMFQNDQQVVLRTDTAGYGFLHTDGNVIVGSWVGRAPAVVGVGSGRSRIILCSFL